MADICINVENMYMPTCPAMSARLRSVGSPFLRALMNGSSMSSTRIVGFGDAAAATKTLRQISSLQSSFKPI